MPCQFGHRTVGVVQAHAVQNRVKALEERSVFDYTVPHRNRPLIQTTNPLPRGTTMIARYLLLGLFVVCGADAVKLKSLIPGAKERTEKKRLKREEQERAQREEIARAEKCRHKNLLLEHMTQRALCEDLELARRTGLESEESNARAQITFEGRDAKECCLQREADEMIRFVGRWKALHEQDVLLPEDTLFYFTGMHEAVRRQSVRTMGALLLAGSALDNKDTREKEPMDVAVQLRCVPAIAFLIEQGVSGERRKGGGLPLKCAFDVEDEELVREILAQRGGCDIDLWGDILCGVTLNPVKLRITELLVEAGVTVKQLCLNGKALSVDPQILELLIKAGATVERDALRDVRLNSVHPDTVRLALKAGASTTSGPHGLLGWMDPEKCPFEQFKEIAFELVRYGADPNPFAYYGYSIDQRRVLSWCNELCMRNGCTGFYCRYAETLIALGADSFELSKECDSCPYRKMHKHVQKAHCKAIQRAQFAKSSVTEGEARGRRLMGSEERAGWEAVLARKQTWSDAQKLLGLNRRGRLFGIAGDGDTYSQHSTCPGAPVSQHSTRPGDAVREYIGCPGEDAV